MDVELTKLSSRGQVVIPQGIRERMELRPGTPFAVTGSGNVILLKKMEIPRFEDLQSLVKETRQFSKQKKIKPEEVKQTIQKVRHKKR